MYQTRAKSNNKNIDLFDPSSPQKLQLKRKHLHTDPKEISKTLGVDAACWDRYWSKLSSGESQRMRIAVAIALSPKILILDESTSALDNDNCILVENLVGGLECTRIWISHSDEQRKRIRSQSFSPIVLDLNSDQYHILECEEEEADAVVLGV